MLHVSVRHWTLSQNIIENKIFHWAMFQIWSISKDPEVRASNLNPRVCIQKHLVAHWPTPQG